MTGIGSIPASEIRQALGRFLFLSLTVARGAARLKPHSHAARGNEKAGVGCVEQSKAHLSRLMRFVSQHILPH
jgi:hypothetical protein